MSDALPELKGSPKDVAVASQLRTPELLEKVLRDLTSDLTSLVRTDSAERARQGLQALPRAMAVLRSIDDAAWWCSNKRCFPPHASKRAYEDYPSALWALLQTELARADERDAQRATRALHGWELKPVDVAAHTALAPVVPQTVDRQLRKGGHRAFLVAGTRVVAFHNGGVRFIGGDGKPTARGAPKGGGQVDAAVLADDGSFVLMRTGSAIHRAGIPDKTLSSWPAPPRTLPGGLCALRSGRFAVIDETPALTVCALDDGAPVVIARTTHADLDSYATIARVDVGDDLLFIVTKSRSGDRLTLVCSWDGTELAWVGRFGGVLHSPRCADDGSILVLAGGQSALRLVRASG